MLRFHDVVPGIDFTIERGREPPRPELSPHQRLQVAARATAVTDAVVEDFGLRSYRTIRLFSTDSQGFLTWEEKADLDTLYENGVAFRITTDLLLPPGTAAIEYEARFAPQGVPIYTYSANEGAVSYWRYDLLFWVRIPSP